MDGKLRARLLQILENEFDERELKKMAYFILGSGSYDDLRGESRPEKALSFLEHLEFRGLIKKLVDYIREFEPEIDLSEFALEPIPTEIQFMNRVGEVKLITDPYAPAYMLISAPLGYGKTKLLEIVKVRFREEGMLCVHCILQKDKQYSIKDLVCTILQELGKQISENEFKRYNTPEQYGFLIAQWLVDCLKTVKTYGILLMMDQVEVLTDDVAKLFLNEVLPGIKEGLSSAGYGKQIRIILSGCYVSNWEQLSRTPLSLMSVTPFSFPVVQRTVDRFMANANVPLPLDSVQEISAHIMYLTGGHPGCMVQLLKEFPAGWPAKAYLIDREDQHYENVIAPVINDARRHIPENLHDVFDAISVVRRFNSRFLRCLIDAGLIRWSKSEYELEDALTRTHMVTRTHGFLHDAITQRLLSIRLRKLDLCRFLEVSEEAQAFYEDGLQESGVNRPDILAIELLFQKLQYIHYKNLGAKDEILAMVPDVLTKLTQGRDAREMLRSCVDLLRKDWEFRFTFNYLLREGIYDDELPYDELIERVLAFASEDGGPQ